MIKNTYYVLKRDIMNHYLDVSGQSFTVLGSKVNPPKKFNSIKAAIKFLKMNPPDVDEIVKIDEVMCDVTFVETPLSALTSSTE